MVGMGEVVDLVVGAVECGADEVVEACVCAVEDFLWGLFAGCKST